MPLTGEAKLQAQRERRKRTAEKEHLSEQWAQAYQKRRAGAHISEALSAANALKDANSHLRLQLQAIRAQSEATETLQHAELAALRAQLTQVSQASMPTNAGAFALFHLRFMVET